jgi:hypothetical protein
VNVRWLAIFQTVEEEPVTANPEQYWHRPSLHPLGWRNPLQWGGLRPGTPTIAGYVSSHYNAPYDLSGRSPPSSLGRLVASRNPPCLAGDGHHPVVQPRSQAGRRGCRAPDRPICDMARGA